MPECMPVRMRVDDLWGQHMRFDQALAGMSCAIFEIPPCKWVRIAGGSATPGWKSDNCPDDNHYSFKIIRVSVDAPA